MKTYDVTCPGVDCPACRLVERCVAHAQELLKNGEEWVETHFTPEDEEALVNHVCEQSYGTPLAREVRNKGIEAFRRPNGGFVFCGRKLVLGAPEFKIVGRKRHVWE